MKSRRFGLLEHALRRTWLVAALPGCLVLPPEMLREGLACAAGIAFEAAPLILATSLLRHRAARRVAALLGCGCGHAVGPAALSLPAAVLCWATFGPWVAGARLGVALLLDRRRSAGHDASGPPDPLAELAAVVEPALLLGLATAFFEGASGARLATAMPAPLAACMAAVLGIAVGALAPCSTAAVALAAMLRTNAPFASAGILATAGLVRFRRTGALPGTGALDGRASVALLAAACAGLALRGGSGLVHPRLVPLLWLGVPCALVALRRAPLTVSPRHALAPAIMLAALVLGSPVPRASISNGSWEGVAPGQRVRFTGPAAFADGRIVLTRYAITCCRADASPVVVRTDLLRPKIAGAWYAADGTVASDGAQTYLHVERLSRVAAPADPFLYR